MNLEAPNDLPVPNLSHSAINLYLQCPEKFRRKYIEREYEPRPGYFILGSAIHAAEAQSYSQKIETGEPFTFAQAADEFNTAFDNEVAAEAQIEWEGAVPGEEKNKGVLLLDQYHKHVVPHVQPEKVENGFEVKLYPDHNWSVVGKIDIIGGYDDGLIKYPSGPHDLKTTKKALPQADLDSSIQATLYTYTTMQPEQDSAVFRFHELKALKNSFTASVMQTVRTRDAHERYLERVAKIAREIAWRAETGTWQGASPNAWWCREKTCGYFNRCPMANRP